MGKLTRRTLITKASVGAGAIGVLTVAAACAPSNPTDTTTNTMTSAAPAVNATDDPLVVFVTDPTKGTLSIIKGEREITVNNLDLANSLSALI